MSENFTTSAAVMQAQNKQLIEHWLVAQPPMISTKSEEFSNTTKCIEITNDFIDGLIKDTGLSLIYDSFIYEEGEASGFYGKSLVAPESENPVLLVEVLIDKEPAPAIKDLKPPALMMDFIDRSLRENSNNQDLVVRRPWVLTCMQCFKDVCVRLSHYGYQFLALYSIDAISGLRNNIELVAYPSTDSKTPKSLAILRLVITLNH